MTYLSLSFQTIHRAHTRNHEKVFVLSVSFTYLSQIFLGGSIQNDGPVKVIHDEELKVSI
jgi:hypothetical protein